MSLNSLKFQAYLAGFIDGDGSIYVRAKPNTSYKYGYQIASYIAFFQSSTSETFPDMVSKIGYGKLRIRKDGIHEFTINKQVEIKDFLEKVSPHLILKQKQARLMLKILAFKANISSKEEFAELLKLIDSFRKFNYSKKRKERILTP